MKASPRVKAHAFDYLRRRADLPPAQFERALEHGRAKVGRERAESFKSPRLEEKAA